VLLIRAADNDIKFHSGKLRNQLIHCAFDEPHLRAACVSSRSIREAPVSASDNQEIPILTRAAAARAHALRKVAGRRLSEALSAISTTPLASC
jgi:hypothetical protein